MIISNTMVLEIIKVFYVTLLLMYALNQSLCACD